MKKGLLLIVTILLFNNLFAQTISLTQKQGDIKVKSGDYELLFKSSDIIDGITFIDKTINTNYAPIAAQINGGQLKEVDMSIPMAETNDFIKLMKTNLGVYLILKAKLGVTQGGTAVASLKPDQGADQLNIDGSKTITIQFVDQNTQGKVFSGTMNAKLF